MPFNEDRLKENIKEAMNQVKDMTENPEQARDLFAQKVAEAVKIEIENIVVTGVCPTGGGALTQGGLK